MIVPQFTFDEEANAYISEEIAVERQAMAHVELASRAPLVTLKQEKDGGYANYGQAPESDTHFEVNITCKDKITIRLATPVEVTKCYVLN